eukprot:5074854-Prorocentrum_lima.AAC.1
MCGAVSSKKGHQPGEHDAPTCAVQGSSVQPVKAVTSDLVQCRAGPELRRRAAIARARRFITSGCRHSVGGA